jgi:hypothetical protein
MSAVEGIRRDARRAIFEAMVALAWADTRIEREEILAVQAAGRLLALADDALDALDAGPPDLSAMHCDGLDEHERRLVYLCAAWLACVDAREEPSEDETLEELRSVLGMSMSEATELRDDARVLRSRAPASLRWHEELASLITDAHSRLSRP